MTTLLAWLTLFDLARADEVLGDLGAVQISDPWSVSTAEALGDGRLGRVVHLQHPAGPAVLMVLDQSQAVSPKALAVEIVRIQGERPPEPEVARPGALAWFHVAGNGRRAWSTGLGGTSALIAADAAVPDEALAELAASIELHWVSRRVDESWIGFDLPDNVGIVHQEAAPYSYTRGDGIVAVDLTFDKHFDESHDADAVYAPLVDGRDGWSALSGSVRFDFQGDALSEVAAWDADTNSKSQVAAPGSRLGASVVSLTTRRGPMRVEVRVEGPDAPVLAWNDVPRIVDSVTLKERYDWFPDARRLRLRRTRAHNEEILAAAGPLVEQAISAGQTLLSGGSLSAAGSAGLSAAQLAPVAFFELFEAGKARTPTEDPVAVTMGWVPSLDLSLRDYFGEGSRLDTSQPAFGVTISAGTRVFGQRAWYGAHYELLVPRGGDSAFTASDSNPYAITDGRLQPMFVRLRTSMNIDPTTHVLPHRAGSFGDFRVGVGLGNVVDVLSGSYVDPSAAEQSMFTWNIGFAVTGGFQARLFWDSLYLYGDGYWAPSQLSLVGFARDSGAADTLDDADLPSLGQALAKGGFNGLMSRAIGTAVATGSQGASLSVVAGIPLRARLAPKSGFGFAPSSGDLAPLGGKQRRSHLRQTLGVGFTWFVEQSTYDAFAAPAGLTPGAYQITTTGMIFGLGTGQVNLPSFTTRR